ncbi:hypothetical protein [Streptomyces sp. NPDC127112]|uniref:hypothetical protein n=1 Tax=Streptomyces sp. NPDC127112 TaxID=3345364 RepID=UPI00363D590D
MADLIAPTPDKHPDYYTVEDLPVSPSEPKFTNDGWEIAFYKRGNRAHETLTEPVDDKARGDDIANPGKDRSYYGFRFFLQRIVRAERVRLSAKHDEPNRADITVQLGGDPAGVNRNEVTPYETAVEVSYNGFTMFGGIIWTCRADFAQQNLTISASDFTSFYAHRVSDHARVNGRNGLSESMDQVDALWCCTVKVSNLNAGIHTGFRRKIDARQVKRDVDLGYGQFNKVQDSLYQWADVEKGFFLYDAPYRQGPATMNGSRYAGTTLNSQIHFTSSRNPVPLAIGGKEVTLVDRENCEVTDLYVDASTYANFSYAVGTAYRSSVEGAQEWVPRATASLYPWDPETGQGTPPTDWPIPLKDVVVKHNIRVDPEDENAKASMKLLQEKANLQLKWGNEPSIIPTVRVYPGLFHPAWFRQPNKALTVNLKSRNDYSDIDGVFVIVGTTIDVDKDGSSVIDLELVQKSKYT